MTAAKNNMKTSTTTARKPKAATPQATTTTGSKSKPPAKVETTSLRLKRVIKAPAKRIYQCFLDPDAYAKWIPPHGFTGHVHKMDPKVGGAYRMSFNTIDRSWGHTFGGKYLELKPYERIVHTDRFEGNDPMFPSDIEMTVTITLRKVAGGTEVKILHEGIPKGPSADGAPIGWGQSLDNLQRMCEQELPF